MNKHTFTLADGTTHTRNSKERVYTHAVVGSNGWVQWCGSAELAHKALRSRCGYPKGWPQADRLSVEDQIVKYGLHIVEVTLLDK